MRGIARDLAEGPRHAQATSGHAGQGWFCLADHGALAFDGDTSPARYSSAAIFVVSATGRRPTGWRGLMAIGLRPISALVDITNYVTYAFSRPLHVFDADRVRGDIQVRLARPGETIAALDGRTYQLDPEMTVIADDEAPSSSAASWGASARAQRRDRQCLSRGGAVRSGAHRRHRTALGIQSDARYRFERGVDLAFIQGAEIATRMILDLCAARLPSW